MGKKIIDFKTRCVAGKKIKGGGGDQKRLNFIHPCDDDLSVKNTTFIFLFSEEKHPRHNRSHPFLDVSSGHFDPHDGLSHRGDGGDGEALRSHASFVLTSHRLLFCHN